MKTPPEGFRRRLRSHNRYVLLAAGASLCATLVVWFAAYKFGEMLTLAARTVIYHNHEPMTGYPMRFGIFLLALLLLTLFLRVRHRFGRLGDHPIIGWHLLPQILLLPASLFFSITDNLAALRNTNQLSLATAWEILQAIQERKKINPGEFGQLGLPQKLLENGLLTLQFTGLVDLHEGRDGWFYRIRSSEEATIQSWISAV